MLDVRFARLLAKLSHSILRTQEKKRFLAFADFEYRSAMLRRLALSYWTPVLAGLVLLGLHLAWAIRWEPAKRGEIVTGFGAWLIVLGLLVAARPYIRSGMREIVDAGIGPPPQDRLRNALEAQLRAPKIIPDELMYLVNGARYANRRAEARRDVLAERVIAVVMIVAGTLLNGYGSPLVRWFGLEG